MSGTVGEIVAALLDELPAGWAEPWDRVGLVVGDPAWPVDRVTVALDLDDRVLDRVAESGARLILVHHPPFIEDVADYVAPSGGQGVAWRALVAGVAVAAFHTNLDRSPPGAEALPRALGLSPIVPLESGTGEADVVTTFVPAEAAGDVTAAMAAAGAGRIGEYEGCSFQADGTGRFTAREASSPSTVSRSPTQSVPEIRVEMVCAPGATRRALEAARGVHPYEEPLFLVHRAHVDRGAARLGRMCASDARLTAGELAERVQRVLGAVPRVWGDGDAELGEIACANGSGTSLVDRARALGADALVCGEVRYHAAKEAADDGLVIVECGHDASEWPLVPVLAGLARDAVKTLEVEVDEIDVGLCWWTWGDR